MPIVNSQRRRTLMVDLIVELTHDDGDSFTTLIQDINDVRIYNHKKKGTASISVAKKSFKSVAVELPELKCNDTVITIGKYLIDKVIALEFNKYILKYDIQKQFIELSEYDTNKKLYQGWYIPHDGIRDNRD